MKRTRTVVIVWTCAFLALCGIGGGYELITLADNVDNNTVSHIIAELTAQYAWLPTAFVAFIGAFFAFWVTVVLHWWGNHKFWWQRAKFIEEEKQRQAKMDAAPIEIVYELKLPPSANSNEDKPNGN